MSRGITPLARFKTSTPEFTPTPETGNFSLHGGDEFGDGMVDDYGPGGNSCGGCNNCGGYGGYGGNGFCPWCSSLVPARLV